LALIEHMSATHGDTASDKRRDLQGGLAAWQERRAKDALQASISSGITLEDLATLCGLSRSHFARAFKQSTGLPPHRWLLGRRVARARDLLLHSTMPLEKIATSCGFADQSHLSRVFSKHVGTSPGAWRRMQRS
jgi:AraC family transcriptional regulator